MFLIYEDNKKISGPCRSFVLCLDCGALSPFKTVFQLVVHHFINLKEVTPKSFGDDTFQCVITVILSVRNSFGRFFVCYHSDLGYFSAMFVTDSFKCAHITKI